MTNYEQQRARYLAVPGGSIRLPQCICEHASLTPDMIEDTQTDTGVVWNIFRACPVHGHRAVEPVLTADLKLPTVLAGTRAVDQGL